MLDLTPINRYFSIVPTADAGTVNLDVLAYDMGTTQEHLAHLFHQAGYCLHNAIEEQNGVVIRNEWFAATRDWVEDYHRNGGLWGYDDRPPISAKAIPVDPKPHAAVTITQEEIDEIWVGPTGPSRPVAVSLEATGIVDLINKYRYNRDAKIPGMVTQIKRALRMYNRPDRQEWLTWQSPFDEDGTWRIVETTGLYNDDYEFIYNIIFDLAGCVYPIGYKEECPADRKQLSDWRFELDVQVQALVNFHKTVHVIDE